MSSLPCSPFLLKSRVDRAGFRKLVAVMIAALFALSPRVAADSETAPPSAPTTEAAAETPSGTPGPPDDHPTSLLDRRLTALVEKQDRILASANQATSEMAMAELTHRMREVTREYESIIALYPEEVTPLLLYGRLLRQIGEREHAHEIYQRANALDPQIAVVKQQLGNYFAENEEHARAMLYFLAAIELAPDEPVYHYTMAEFLFLFRDDFVADEAYDADTLDRIMIDAFAKAARLSPHNPDLQFRHAEAFYDIATPDWEGALQAWDAILAQELTPIERAAARLHRARILYKLERYPEAREAARAVATPGLRPSRDQLLEDIAEAEKKAGF